jgi:cyanophycinase
MSSIDFLGRRKIYSELALHRFPNGLLSLIRSYSLLKEGGMKKLSGVLLLFIFTFSLGAGAASRGHLFIIGGGTRPESMMKKFIALAEAAPGGKIVVFPMASATPEESGRGQVEEFKKYGAKSAEYHILTHEQALAPGAAELLKDAGGVYFTGGDQARIIKSLLDTTVHKELLEIYEKGAVIGGTSAGAAVMSEIMITGNERREVKEGQEFSTLLADIVVTAPGLGFLKSAIVDQHFATRKRHNRLISLIAENPSLLGVGIDESTAIVVNPDETFDVIGEKDVMIFDPSKAKVKITAAKNIGISNMIVHVLLPGTKYDLKRRRIVTF